MYEKYAKIELKWSQNGAKNKAKMSKMPGQRSAASSIDNFKVFS